ncbi:MAG TPA: aminoglycoside 3'-phosphotransferase, partial [Pseudonocardia sp.]
MRQPSSLLDLLPRDVRGSRAWIAVTTGESNAEVFRREDGWAYAKCIGPDGIDELDAECRRVEWLSGTGIPGPDVGHWSASDRGACLVTTAVPGVPASRVSPVQLRSAWRSITDMVRRLHALPAADCPFDRSLARTFRLAEDVVGRGAVNSDFLPGEHRHTPPSELLAELRPQLERHLLQETHDRVVCHGDACLPNLMLDPRTAECTGLIDLGRLGTADRYADIALLLASSRETWCDEDEAACADDEFFRSYGIETV